MRASRSASLEMTSSRPAPLRLLEPHVVALERERGAVDRRERRAELVRHGRDEVALQLLDRALLGHVAERVDRAAGERGRPRSRATARCPSRRRAAVSGAPRARLRRAVRRRCGRARSASRRTTSSMRRPIAFAGLTAKARAAAGFRSRTISSRSTSRTPSSTNSSASVARARACASRVEERVVERRRRAAADLHRELEVVSS